MTRVLWLAVLVCVVQCLPMSQDELEDFSNFLLKTSSLDIHVKSAVPDGSYDEDDVVSDHAWEESGKFEGDLILNDRQRRLIVENVEGLSRNGLTDSTKRWPNNEVIYFIQKEHFTGGQVQAIQDGIDDLARASCVKFRPYRKGDRDAVVIQGSRRGCFSQVGYQGGFQVLNLSGRHPVGRGCFRHGTVVHELLHSLGFYHMQSSPDRDDYIDVIWSNIVQPARHNFRKYNSFSVSDFGVGYDYDSVLHYSRRAFSANGQDTLVPKKSGAEIGQRVGLSDKDTQKLNKMYCDADNDPIQEDENITKKPKNKKKKPKNQPFQGHGIGYHQGKTVVIELPAAQIHKLPNVPSTHVFDFSKTPEVVPPEDGGYRFGKEVTYSYKPILALNAETIKDYQNSHEFKLAPNTDSQKPHEDSKEKVISLNEENNKRTSAQHFNDSNEVKPEHVPIDEHDKDLKDTFHRLTKIVKQHVYPQNQPYVHKINKDYSKFYSPLRTQQFDPSQDSFDETLEQPKSYDQTLIIKKQIETKPFKVRTDGKSKDNFKNSQWEERMNAFYGVSLPTKKPYSSNQQTETPYYATLEYLNNRHDYSSLYSPDSNISNKHKDEVLSSSKSGKYEHDVKINPYDQVYLFYMYIYIICLFYTNFVKEGSKDHLKNVPLKENISKQFKSNKYELVEIAMTMQLDPTKKKVEDRMDSSYKLFLPTKKPYSAYEQTETPKYATLEYLKDRHDFSNLYTKKNSDDVKQKKPYTLLGVELPPTEGDWYKKDSYKHNPANYDQDLYSDHVHQDRNENQRKKDTKDREINVFKYNDSEPSRKSPDKTQDKHKTENDGQNTDYDVKENQGRLINKQVKDHEEKYVHSYSSTPGNNGNDYSKYHNSHEEDSGRGAPKNNQFKHEPVENSHNYYTDYEKEYNGRLVEGSSENDDENSKESSKKSQAYALYDAPVPVTRNWFKPSYIIPEISKEDENSGSHEDYNDR